MEPVTIVFELGPIAITRVVVVTWGIMASLGFLSWLATRRLALTPGPMQAIVEGVVEAIDNAIRAAIPNHAELVLPFVGTLWIFIAVANLIGLIPGLSSPTANLSTTAGLAVLVFLAVHYFGIRADGIRAYLRHYLKPIPLMLPFHLVSEVSRTLALAVRLFGNIMSLELAALMVLLVAGFLVPVPILMLHIVEALVQAYIFGMLALVFVSGAIQSQEIAKKRDTQTGGSSK